MKTIAAALCALCILFTACGSDSNKKQDKKPVAAKADALLPNYRYVDMDSVLSQYLLAKDYNEQMIQKQTEIEATARQKQTSLQSHVANLQKKYEAISYPTPLEQQQMQRDQQNLAQMQENAEKSISEMQTRYQNEFMAAQAEVNDSIQKFILEYNALHGYDAILYKQATLYINPALDITEEVVEGLNAKYNKQQKK